MIEKLFNSSTLIVTGFGFRMSGEILNSVFLSAIWNDIGEVLLNLDQPLMNVSMET